jgi:hypothetical protein
MLLSIYNELIMPLCAIQVYVKRTLKTLVLHPVLKRLFRKSTRKAIAVRVAPEVQFLPKRAAYKREHPIIQASLHKKK